jgi:hypothetical protein
MCTSNIKVAVLRWNGIIQCIPKAFMKRNKMLHNCVGTKKKHLRAHAEDL